MMGGHAAARQAVQQFRGPSPAAAAAATAPSALGPGMQLYQRDDALAQVESSLAAPSGASGRARPAGPPPQAVEAPPQAERAKVRSAGPQVACARGRARHAPRAGCCGASPPDPTPTPHTHPQRPAAGAGSGAQRGGDSQARPEEGRRRRGRRGRQPGGGGQAAGQARGQLPAVWQDLRLPRLLGGGAALPGWVGWGGVAAVAGVQPQCCSMPPAHASVHRGAQLRVGRPPSPRPCVLQSLAGCAPSAAAA